MTREHFGPPFDRIVGGSEKQKEQVKKDMEAERVRNFVMPPSEYSDYETKLTNYEYEILRFVEQEVDGLVERYGGVTKPIRKNRLVFYDLQQSGLEKFGGRCDFAFETVVLERESAVALGIVAAHEFFHIKSERVLQIEKPRPEKVQQRNIHVKLYKVGISIFDRKKNERYLYNFHEAIMAEMTQVLYRTKMRNNPLFENEVRAVDAIKPWIRKWLATREDGEENKSKAEERLRESLNELYTVPDAERIAEEIRAAEQEENAEKKRLAIIEKLMAQPWTEAKVVGLRERYRERQKLNEVLDAIREKSGGKYKTRKEVFDEFARANFTGNILTVGRLITQTFGKGSLKTIDIGAIKEV